MKDTGQAESFYVSVENGFNFAIDTINVFFGAWPS